MVPSCTAVRFLGITIAVLIAVSCTVTCADAVVLPKKSAAAAAAKAPTKAQLKAELKKMVANVTKYFPRYRQYTKQATQTINVALSSKYNFTALRDATILLVDDVAFKNLSKKIPGNSKNIPKVYNITAYHLIAKKYTLPQLRALRPGTPLPTQLYRQQPLFKMTGPANKNVAFGKLKGAPPKTWTVIRSPNMYTGPYFTAHGIDVVQIPMGTKV